MYPEYRRKQVKTISEVVGSHYGLHPSEFMVKDKHEHIQQPKLITYALCREFMSGTTKEISIAVSEAYNIDVLPEQISYSSNNLTMIKKELVHWKIINKIEEELEPIKDLFELHIKEVSSKLMLIITSNYKTTIDKCLSHDKEQKNVDARMAIIYLLRNVFDLDSRSLMYYMFSNYNYVTNIQTINSITSRTTRMMSSNENYKSDLKELENKIRSFL